MVGSATRMFNKVNKSPQAISWRRQQIAKANVNARIEDNPELYQQQKRMNQLAIQRHGIEGIYNWSDRRTFEKALANANDKITYDVFGVDPTKKVTTQSQTISAGFQHLESYAMSAGSEKFNNTLVRAELARIRDQLSGETGDKGKLRSEIDAYLEQFPKNRNITSGQGVADAKGTLAAISQHIRDQFNVDWINEWHGIDLEDARKTSYLGSSPTSRETLTADQQVVILTRENRALQDEVDANNYDVDAPVWARY